MNDIIRPGCGLGVIESYSGKPVVEGKRMLDDKISRQSSATAILCIVTAAACLHTAFSADQTQLPPELAFIQDIIDDEDQTITAVRKFDRVQQSLASWDMDIAQELGGKGDTEAADERAESARTRIGLIDQAYRIVLHTYPENSKALTFHGELLYDHFGDQNTAIKNWRLAAAFDRELSAPHNNLGLHYFHTGDYRLGLRELDRALELDGELSDYHYNMAQIYLVHGPQIAEMRGWDQKRIYREAMKHSKKAAELAPRDYDLQQDYAVNFFAAENFDVAADWKEAAEAWSTARARARNQTEEFYTWLNEARVWIEHGDAKRAEPCLQAALAIMPDSGVALGLLEKLREKGD